MVAMWASTLKHRPWILSISLLSTISCTHLGISTFFHCSPRMGSFLHMNSTLNLNDFIQSGLSIISFFVLHFTGQGNAQNGSKQYQTLHLDSCTARTFRDEESDIVCCHFGRCPV